MGVSIRLEHVSSSAWVHMSGRSDWGGDREWWRLQQTEERRLCPWGGQSPGAPISGCHLGTGAWYGQII